MGQSWNLYNLDKHEVCYAYGKLGEFFFSPDTGSRLQELLTRPEESSSMVHRIEKDVLHSINQTKTNQLKPDSSELNKSIVRKKISKEILSTICGFINNLDTIIFFALACPRFWEVAKPHIVRVRDNLIAERTWAGSRIICAGDYQDHDDWPSSITKEEYKLFLAKDGWPDRRNARFVDFRSSCRQMFYKITKSERTACKHICDTYCDGGSFILRNISKKLFVYERGFDKLLEGCVELRPEAITLGHIALAQICWSTDPSTSLCYEGPIHRGPWAGDRLEIVSINQHIKEITEATKINQKDLTDTVEQSSPFTDSHAPTCTTHSGWEDVTEECMKLIENIWEEDYGDEWKERILKRPRPSEFW